MRRRLLGVLLGSTIISGAVPAQEYGEFAQGRQVAPPVSALPQRDRVEPINRMLERRLDELLPRLMREADIDLWLVVNREYAEDPVYFSLVPEPVFAARRTTMLMFHEDVLSEQP